MVGTAVSAEEVGLQKNEGVKMRRIGKTSNLIEQIIDENNLDESINAVLHGRRRKKSRAGRRILANRDKVKSRLAKAISEGTFHLTGYYEREVTDGPKNRIVQSVNLYERIGCHAIMNVVEKYVYGRYIRTTGASIKRRGMHDLMNYIRNDIKMYGDEMKYFYKSDIRKFYESIDQDVMMTALRKLFKDRILLTILERFVRMMPKGLSIGLRSSQGFGNILLSIYLDHIIKDKHAVKHYYRYCDDKDVHHSSKRECWKTRDKIHEAVNRIGMDIKPNERVAPITEGLDFLGYVLFPTHTRLRKRNKQKAARKLHKVKSKKRRVELVASLYGQCKHADCKNLFKKLTGMSMEEYKRLKDFGIKPQYDDGKKRFNCEEINISELEGEEYVIEDFESGVITKPLRKDYDAKVEEAKRIMEEYQQKNIPLPKGYIAPDQIPLPIGKYLVHIKYKNGKTAKFFTGDKENWSILEQMRKQELLGKCLCSVEKRKCKGFCRWVIC